MQLDKKYLQELSNDYGFIRDTLEKQLRLADVLDRFNNDSYLSDKLSLKGGTNINLFVLNGPRLSLDIDLDYTAKVDKKAMLEERKNIYSNVLELVSKDYTIIPPDKKYHALDSIELHYKNNNQTDDKIKLDINYMCRTHILPEEQKQIKAPWCEKDIHMQCVNEYEVFASKMVALSNRAKPRDLYDTARLSQELNLSNGKIDLMHKCYIFYAAIGSKNPMETISSQKYKYIDYDDVKKSLTPVLSKNERFNLTGSRNLLNELMPEMQSLDYTDKEFLDEFQKGRYRPELLFDDEEILGRIAMHPMAQWKCANNAKQNEGFQDYERED